MPENKWFEKIGILTVDGDCPGLNALIRAVVKKSVKYCWEAIGIKNGWKGLISREMEEAVSKSKTVDMELYDIAKIFFG